MPKVYEKEKKRVKASLMNASCDMIERINNTITTSTQSRVESPFYKLICMCYYNAYTTSLPSFNYSPYNNTYTLQSQVSNYKS